MASSNAPSRAERIAILNDNARWAFDRTVRHVVTPACVAALAPDDTQLQRVWARARLLMALRQARFSGDTPERDRAEFTIDGHRLRFRIDYYDPTLRFGSEDPADAACTVRVITIMLCGED
ncbi:DUF3768 domain-containing protein [Sphingomonas sp. H39-1-10]|uniref:DUF3768 domain-containing protein n=1 Tax=Sphingomonas pollutisoli TaxID=3030829 RepID=UPI0023B8A39B|nr:DUF3768 domain-containing protein [Sphingomonas pollutisoli]MDF0490399.1 DUF3768 domain-containing protein [Sphingomonas pollutisoli]